MPIVMGNYPSEMFLAKSGRFVENGAGTYNFDIDIPAEAVVMDVIVHAEALWTAATSASMEIGFYTTSTGAAIDADGLFTAVDLKAADLLAGETVNFSHPGAQEGADVTQAAIGAHVRNRVSTVARILRARVVSVGAGTAGRTIVTVLFAQPPMETITR